ncbi:16180_t:CDS:2, partial [Funneliformis caledonium]
AIHVLNNGQITALQINTPDGTVVPVLSAGATRVLFIPAYDVYTDENWSYAGDVLKLCKYAKLAQIGDREKKMQFLRGLNFKNKLEVKHLRLNKALNNDLIENLEEIEKEKSEMLLGENIYNQSIAQKVLINQGITTADVEKIINTRIQALLQE